MENIWRITNSLFVTHFGHLEQYVLNRNEEKHRTRIIANMQRPTTTCKIIISGTPAWSPVPYGRYMADLNKCLYHAIMINIHKTFQPKMNRHMGWSTECNCYKTHYKAPDTPNLNESSGSVTSVGDNYQWGLYRLHYSVSCAPTRGKRTSWAVLVNIRAMSCVQADKQALLVAYPAIDIRDSNIFNSWNRRSVIQWYDHSHFQKSKKSGWPFTIDS